MIEKFNHDINGINVYIDEYQEDNKVLTGRKQGITGIQYMVMNKKTADLMYNIFITKKRREKILKLKNIIKNN